MRRNQGKKEKKREISHQSITEDPLLTCIVAKKGPTKKNLMEPRKATIKANNTPYATTRSRALVHMLAHTIHGSYVFPLFFLF
jgi:hypothetical protein